VYNKNKVMSHSQSFILKRIKGTATEVMPKGTEVILFGSQARGDARADSDWDVLILLDKEKIEPADYDNYSYPLYALGWEIDAQIHPIMYTRSEWERRSYSPLFQNISKEGITLC
jgi:predicted nucleotidyltransferase